MTPKLTLSDSAKTALQAALDGASDAIHLRISATFEHALDIAEVGDAQALVIDGVTFVLDAESAARADGLHIDFVETPSSAGFRIENPNAPPKITEIDAAELAARLASKEIEVLVDVRTTWERELASIQPSELLDETTGARLHGLDRNTPIAFYCHHGVRSHAAAAHFIELGFTKVYNLTGGIDAWSKSVDPSVPTY